MSEFFRNLSKASIAGLAIGVGILFIVLSDPPHTICRSQLERFKEQQVGFLLRDKKSKDPKTGFEKDLDRCKASNNPGGCYELFAKIRSYLQSTDTIDLKCLTTVGSESAVKNFYNKTIDLFSQLAWGSVPPENVNLKFGWLDTSDLNLYCQLKDRFILTYGNAAYQQKIERAFSDLPGSKQMPREQAWQLMLFSANCKVYL